MITIYEDTATDFGTLGLGALTPSEAFVDEDAGGLYELSLTQPMNGRHRLLRRMRIIKAPAPVRETPEVETSSGSVTREIYKVTTDGRRLYLRTGPSQTSRGIHAYSPGTEVAVTDKTDAPWWKVIVLDGGATGWMYSGNLTFVRNETETISGDTPGTVIRPRQTREQLFRIYRIERDGTGRKATAYAKHISYDLEGAIVAENYSPEDVPANQVVTNLLTKLDHDIAPFRIFCTVTNPISGDFGGKNLINCLLDPDDGISTKTNARVIRDNYDIFIVPDERRELGVTLRYGKNLLTDLYDTDTSEMVTRIQPVGKNDDGEDLFIDLNDGFVDSDRIDDYPIKRAERRQYDVVVGREGMTEQQAKAKLQQLARADLAEGIDLPTDTLNIQFVRDDVSSLFADLATETALHLYDQAEVIDEEAGLRASMRMTGYRFDVLLSRYDDTELTEVPPASQRFERTVTLEPSETAYVAGTNGWHVGTNLYQGVNNRSTYRTVLFFNAINLTDDAEIKSATLTMKRESVGEEYVNLHLLGTPVTTTSGNPTTGATDYGVLAENIARETTKTVQIPVNAVKDLIDGTIGALMLDPGDPYDDTGAASANYAQFDGSAAALEITYTEGEVERGMTYENGVISITRGDNGKMVFDPMTDGEGEPYTMQEGDFITLTVRKRPTADSPVLMQIASVTNEINITHEDSAQLDAGSYSADVQMTFADGHRQTIWPVDVDLTSTTANLRNFEIKPEVTRI